MLKNTIGRIAAVAAVLVCAIAFGLATAVGPSALAASGKTGVWDVAGRHSAQAFHPGAGATDATSSEVIFEAPVACRIKRVAFIPSAAITGQASHYFALDVINTGTDGAGTTSVLSAARTYSSAPVADTAFNATELTLSTTDATISLASGAVLTAKRTKTGNGLLMPSSVWVVEFEPK